MRTDGTDEFDRITRPLAEDPGFAPDHPTAPPGARAAVYTAGTGLVLVVLGVATGGQAALILGLAAMLLASVPMQFGR